MKILLIILMALSLNAKHLHSEKYYADKICSKLNGEREYYTIHKTRVDCLTDTLAIEVDFASKWYEAVGQSLYYGLLINKKPAVYLIVEKDSDLKYLSRFVEVAIKYNIEVIYD